MKKSLLLSLILSGTAFAGFENWTNKEGKTAELELIKVTGEDGEKAGEFKMRNGKTVTLKAADLAEADAARLQAWKPAEEAAATAGAPSVYDKLLGGKLVQLTGKRVARAKDVASPAKYYVFYYSASWCAPCQKFTPSLVEFYNSNKNPNFEVYFISSDNDEDAMEGYIKDKEMPWPALRLKETPDFKKEIVHDVAGIPFIAVTTPDGEVVEKGNAYSVLPKLQSLLAQ